MKLPLSTTHSAIILCLVMLNVCTVNIVMLSVAVFRYSESFMLSVVMLNVVVLSVAVLLVILQKNVAWTTAGNSY